MQGQAQKSKINTLNLTTVHPMGKQSRKEKEKNIKFNPYASKGHAKSKRKRKNYIEQKCKLN